MIKVRDKNGDYFEKGIQVMQDIVRKRMPLSFFQDLNVLREMILYSGGCLRDLFGMIIDAADNALDHNREIIEPDDVKAAYYSLKAEYEYTIAYNKEKDLTVDDYFEALIACVKDTQKSPKSSKAMPDLRNNLAVLNYQNGDTWGDVHPVVKDILKERGLLDD